MTFDKKEDIPTVGIFSPPPPPPPKAKYEINLFGKILLFTLAFGLFSHLLLSVSQNHESDFLNPVDFEPKWRYNGGWPSHHGILRITGSISGMYAAVALATRLPSTDGFAMINFLQYLSSGLLLLVHVLDIRLLFTTRAEKECRYDNYNWICTFQRYYAIAVMECIAGVVVLVYAIFITKNIATHRYYQNQDDQNPNYTAKDKHRQNLVSLFCIILIGPIIGLQVTQSSYSYIYVEGENGNMGIDNFNFRTPRDLFKVSSTENFLYGGWPALNYRVRIGAIIGGFLCVSCIIPIMSLKKFVIHKFVISGLCFVFGAVLGGAFVLDYNEYNKIEKCITLTNFMDCKYHRYNAVLTLNFLLGFLLLLVGPMFLYHSYVYRKAKEAYKIAIKKYEEEEIERIEKEREVMLLMGLNENKDKSHHDNDVKENNNNGDGDIPMKPVEKKVVENPFCESPGAGAAAAAGQGSGGFDLLNALKTKVSNAVS